MAEAPQSLKPEQTVSPPPVEKKKLEFKVGIVAGARDIEAAARDIAEERLTAGQEELRGVTGVFARIWKYNWGKEYYRQKEIIKAKQELLKAGNIYAAEEAGAEAEKEALGAIVERFISEYDQKTLQAGEEKHRLERPEEEKVKEAIRKLVVGYATAKPKDAAAAAQLEANFLERRNRLIRWISDGSEEPSPEVKALVEVQERKRPSEEEIEKEFSYADNISDIARQVRQAIEHGERLENLDLDFEVVIGKAKAGVKTETQFNTVDRIIEKVSKIPVTRLLNETTVASGVAIAASVAGVFSQRLARSKLFAYGTFGATALFGGGLALARERVRLEEERRAHSRALAKGKTFDPERAPQRKELSEYLYQMRGAKDLADGLENSLYTKNEKGERVFKPPTNQAELDLALANLAEIEARQQISETHQIDLISFSDPTRVEVERTRLLLLKAQAEGDLRRLTIAEAAEQPEQFGYDVKDLVDHVQIKGLLSSDKFKGLAIEKRQAAIADWLEQRRLSHLGGYRVAEIESRADFKPFTTTAAESYQQWDREEAGKILAAWEKPAALPTAKGLSFGKDKTLDNHLLDLVGVQSAKLFEGDEGIERKNELFAKLKQSRSFKAGLRGVITGLVIGATVQEAAAFFKEGQEGFVESLIKGHRELTSGTTAHFTPLEYVRRYFSGELSPAYHGPLHEVAVAGAATRFHLPEGLSMALNPDHHSYSLYRGDELIDQSIMLQPDGTISRETEGILADHGVLAHTTSFHTPHTVTERVGTSEDITKHPDYATLKPEAKELLAAAPPPPETITETVSVKPDEYLRHHADLAPQVHREFWYDNDTPNFDKNELNLHWGGLHGSGIDKEGNFIYTIKGMATEGSFHDKFKINPFEAAKEGKLKLLLSLSKDTQAHPIAVPIDVNGNALIKPDSDIAKMFFHKDSFGQLHFVGKFAEVAEVTGAKDGVEQIRVLATDVGKGLETVTDTIVKEISPAGIVSVAKEAGVMVPPTPETIIKQIIDTHREIIFDSPGDYRIDPPPIIPLLGRRPLEPLAKKEVVPLPYYLYGTTPDKNRLAFYQERRSPTLKENPAARLDHYQEAGRYLNSLEADYREQVDQLKNQIPPMEKSCRAVVCIPAAGHQEGKNIYRTLENYTRQTITPDQFEITVLVNHPDKDKQGNPIKPDNTREEIARFQKEHPEVKVRMLYTVIPTKKITIGYVRKLLNDTVLLRHRQRGEEVPDLIMISNDADNYGVAPTYLENFATKLEQNPKTDALLGQLDWDPESYIKKPLVHIGTRLFQYISVQSRKRGYFIDSSGANFAFRSSIYAAVGGYAADRAGGEDSEFGEMIKQARRGATDPEIKPVGFAGVRVSRVYTSARRAINAIKNGLAPIEQWDRGFSAFDDEVRKFEFGAVETGIDFDNPEEVRKLVSATEVVINRTIAKTKQWGGRASDPALNRALGWLGLTYDIIDDQTIKIIDATNLLKGLKEYQQIGLLMRDSKVGKPGAAAALRQVLESQV